jgi:DNA-binding response OmpR family regulator
MSESHMELRPALTSAMRRPAATSAVAARPASGAAMPRVLVVDDNAQVRSAVTRFLRMQALQVDVAADGRAALAALQAQPADFILLDVDMPGMDGFEVCRRIKANPANAFTPVIMLTALDSSDDRIRGAEAGADGYLTKPVPPAELIARVKAGLRQREMVMTAIRVACAAVAGQQAAVAEVA